MNFQKSEGTVYEIYTAVDVWRYIFLEDGPSRPAVLKGYILFFTRLVNQRVSSGDGCLLEIIFNKSA